LDTVGLIAVWDKSDQWHDAAEGVFLELVASGRVVVTTSLVLFECGNAASRRPYRSAVDDLRAWLVTQEWLIEPTGAEIAAAWADYRASNVGSAGIVDYVSFHVMRRLGITEAFTNDRHYQVAGFTVLF
jgi:predicted nucleic acid-binding protein